MSDAATSTRRVPYFDYAKVYEAYRPDIDAAIDRVLRRGAYILQAELTEFENALAEFLDVRNCIGVANGTDALILALRAVGVGVGDEVVVPSHTYVASAAAVWSLGATPVLADCGEDHLVDVASMRALISSKTKALMPVHLNGRMCDMDGVSRLARERSLIVVEDAAQAVGARFDNRSPGTFNSIAALSFYPAKILGCLGDGGAVLTNDADLAEAIRQLRDHGRRSDGQVVSWGFNSRLDTLQAAVLLAKLSALAGELERRREIARRYHEGLGAVGTVELPPHPDENQRRYDVFQNFEIRVENRAIVQEALARAGVGTILPWGGRAVHQIDKLGLTANVPGTDHLFEGCLLLPMNQFMTDDDVEYVIDQAVVCAE